MSTKTNTQNDQFRGIDINDFCFLFNSTPPYLNTVFGYHEIIQKIGDQGKIKDSLKYNNMPCSHISIHMVNTKMNILYIDGN